MKLLKEIKEFEVPAGELLEFKDTAEMIQVLLSSMPGYYLIWYTFNDETLETKVRVSKTHD